MNVEAEMSFQHEEPEFDFSYVFEYSQEGQNEPETGGCSRAMEGFFLSLYCMSCMLHSVRALDCTVRLQKSFYMCAKMLNAANQTK